MTEEIKVPSFPYSSGIDGHFGIQTSKSQVKWENCRDRFQTASETLQSFLFFHSGKGKNVVNFIRTFEAACNCPYDQELVMKDTTNKDVMWVGMSEWWRYRLRRSLLTALLRCGRKFVKDTGKDFAAALNSEIYMNSTKTAVEWFMSGHTACRMRRHETFPGWQHFFQTKTKGQIEAVLVKVKKK